MPIIHVEQFQSAQSFMWGKLNLCQLKFTLCVLYEILNLCLRHLLERERERQEPQKQRQGGDEENEQLLALSCVLLSRM